MHFVEKWELAYLTLYPNTHYLQSFPKVLFSIGKFQIVLLFNVTNAI